MCVCVCARARVCVCVRVINNEDKFAGLCDECRVGYCFSTRISI